MPTSTMARTVLTLLALGITLVSSQSILTYGGSGGLPTCAQQCTTLTSAQSACIPPAVPASDTTAYWVCFCQTTALDPLWQSASAAFCSSCDAADQTDIVSWFKTNCGSDNGVSEHQGTATTAAAGATTASNVATSAPSNTAASGTTTTGANTVETGSWWSNHYKWVIMVIVIVAGFLLIALVGALLKRRHDRRRDLITSGFNEGITTRTTPDNSTTTRNVMSGGYGAGEGRDTPSRTREAFMPYGYSYSRSESRLAGRNATRGATPMGETEKNIGTPRGKGKAALVSQAGLRGDENEIEKAG